ncbi:phosphotriesterase family protein [Microbacterium allomyrinae]|uniref:Phosphotriesterase n=1 Tax=Microbacterium allomyrinae TaxID=2830666 RepID=A0A9X1S2T6_9MICO|nr:phosphotriesterase [Microbacterium allomyrinae]MCC2031243.1 phosphotriesterase [Microbacterium allomyrinae]
MGVINTVLGPIPTEQLGITAVHEHINFGQNGWYLESDFWTPISETIARAEQQLADYRALGGRTYVDLTGIGNFRSVELYRVIARATGINFVACTGFWTGMGTRPFFWDKPVEYLTDLFVKEITVGIDDTAAKAGVIKVGVSHGGLSDMDKKIYTAAGRAAVATGVPILTHLSTDAMTQLDILEAQGLSPERVVIGHADAGVDIDRKRDIAVAQRGAFVGIDNIGYETEKTPRVPWAQARKDRLRQLLDLLEAGYVKNVAVSADADVQPLGWKSPPHSVAELLTRFAPDLREEGVDESMIDQLLVGNPARLLTIQEA